MVRIKYEPLKLTVFVYTNPKEYSKSEYKPFGDLSWVNWDYFAGMDVTAFITKGKPELHVYIEKECKRDELLKVIAHELGHLQPKIVIKLNEEKKADMYEEFIGHVLKVSNLIESVI